jgi:hypothetical protein
MPLRQLSPNPCPNLPSEPLTHIPHQYYHTNSPSQIKNPQSALLSNHELLLHLRQEDAEYTGEDGTDRKRWKPKGLEHMLRDVRKKKPPINSTPHQQFPLRGYLQRFP